MAYMSQERKAELAPQIKEICKKYGVKASIRVDHHSTLELNVKSSKIDFLKSYNERAERAWPFNPHQEFRAETNNIQVNTYHFDKHFDGQALEFLTEVHQAMNVGNFDNSDIQSDYFSVGWYTDINIGRWNKPYILEN